MVSVEDPEIEPGNSGSSGSSPGKETPGALTPTGSAIQLTPATPVEETSPEKPKPNKPRSPWDTRHEFAHVDRMFMIAFPICFISFNVLYWTICIYFQDYLKSEE